MQSAEAIYNPSSEQKSTVDHNLVATPQPRRLRVSSRLSVHGGERTVNKSMARMHEWRTSIIATERKRLRKAVLDL